MAKIQLDISKDQAVDLLEYYVQKRAALVKEYGSVIDKINEYAITIANLRKIMSSEDGGYPAEGSWNQKIQFVLKDYVDGLTVRDIAAKIADLERLKNPEDVKRMYNSVSPTLSTAVGSIYDRKSNSSNEYVYSLRK